MTRARSLRVGFLLIFLSLGPSTAHADSTLEASGRVADLHENLISVMKAADELGFEGRSERLGPLIGEAFDLEFMAMKSLGLAGKQLSDADRVRWVQVFSAFIVSNYARNFDGYSGQRFETLGEDPAPRGTVVVRSELIRGGGQDDVRLDYRLRHGPDGWKVIDIYSNGTVSELALRRSEFSSLFSREGFASLLSSVQRKTLRQ